MIEPPTVLVQSRTFPLATYDLDATFNSGQAFRWQRQHDAWIGVIGRHWVRLAKTPSQLTASCAVPTDDWDWLIKYLQLDVDLDAVLSSFPGDEPLRAAIGACRGLRLLRQDPWECLASFILSSTKQIVQIQQIVALLCERFGDPIPTLSGSAFAFPAPQRLAQCSETELRGCKMGFRAPYLLATARAVAGGEFCLERISRLSLEDAREQLIQLPGVGRKIADCVLLFAYGFQTAFPVDVWVMKALRQLYFPKRRVTARRIHQFSATYFGPHAGYAQQYLFHYMRTRKIEPAPAHNIVRRKRAAVRSR